MWNRLGRITDISSQKPDCLLGSKFSRSGSLLRDEKRLHEMGKQARATAMERFCSTKIVKQYEDFYRRVLERSA